MSWHNFFENLIEEKAEEPGKVMICFMNRYLEALDGIQFIITHDGERLNGTTTEENYCFEIQPTTLNPIQVFVWSRKAKGYKRLNDVIPVMGRGQLVRKIMRSVKVDSRTEKHPEEPSFVPRPTQPPPPTPHGESPVGHQGVKITFTKNERGEPQTQVERAVPNKITVLQLRKIFPNSKLASDAYLQKVADELNTDLVKYQLNTPLRRAHFFAQVREETGTGLKVGEESLNYLSNILKINFKYYQHNPEEADQDGRLEEIETIEKIVHGKMRKIKVKTVIQKANQEAIANKAYGNREGNRDSSTGDGWKYRGRGIFQLTFKKNYSAFFHDYSKYWSDESPDFTEYPEKVKDFPYNIRSAVWFWLSNKIYKLADKGATDEAVSNVTTKINKKRLHLSERQKNFKNITYPAFK